MKKVRTLTASLMELFLVLFPVLAFAQGILPLAPIPTLGALQAFICTVVINWMFTFLIVLAVVLALGAAYYLMTSGGNPDRKKSGNNAILYFVIAIVLALFARGFPFIIGSLFTGGTGGVTC